MYIKRKIERLLAEALKQFPVVLVTGPRQAGKSTLLRHALKKHHYVTLDDPLSRQMARQDPELFLANHPPPVVIDEIQYAPELLPYIKIEVDQNRRKKGQYVLTGSQTFQVMDGISESLAGRIAIFHLFPFSWEEISHVKGYKTISGEVLSTVKQMIRGFYPEFFVNSNLDPSLWYGSYLSTYIERDVRNIKHIPDLGRFQLFISLLAARAGQLLNISELSKECGITQPTVKSWLSILESTYVIYLLKPYHKNRTKRLVKMPKIYFVDTGFLCYLLGIDASNRLMKASERGHIFENMVIMEKIKQLAYEKQRSECYFYRTASGVEIDLLVEKAGKLDLYEIKFAKSLKREMARNLVQFKKTYEVDSAHVLSLQKKSHLLAEGVKAEHWSQIFK